jgi:hydrophobe/amphiphile efflux-1 (HAE1) family protein
MLSRFFINRPIFAAVVSIVIVIAGVVTLLSLPVAMYPEISPPTISVSTAYPGANAAVVAETVAAPIEQEINGVEGMLYMSSTCSNTGSYSLTITFDIGTDTNMAAVLVQNRVAIATPSLPEDVKRIGVTTKKVSSNMVLMVALTSPGDEFDELYLSNYATLRVKDELARIDGVGDIQAFGAGDYSMRFWLDPYQLKARSLTTTDVINAIQEQNVQVAAGQIGAPPAPPGQNFQYTVNTLGRLADVEQFENIILKTGDGGRITRIKDVARVELGSQSYGLSGHLAGAPTALLGVSQLPGANALTLAKKIRAKMSEISRTFPEGLEYQIPFDTTMFVKASIREVIETLLIAILLVFLTIFVFLQDWRATLIPALTIPVSLIGTFAVMGLLGFSINMLTLFGIVLAIGIVVDDAIVVVENTARNIDDHNMSAREGAIRAMDEVSGPVIATTLVLMAVFIPTAFLGGITGQLYRQFSLTIAVSTFFSSINALTLSPALAAILLRPSPKRRNFLFRAFNWTFDLSRNIYKHLVGATIRRSVIMMILFLGIAGGTYRGFTSLPTGFVPEEDQGYALVSVQLPDAASYERTKGVINKINGILKNIKGVKTWVSIVGYSLLDSSESSNAATMWVIFDPWDERMTPDLSAEALVGQMWGSFGRIQEANIFAFIPPAISGLGAVGGFQMQVQNKGGLSLDTLQNLTQEMVQAANGQPGLTRVNTTFRANVPQLFAQIDRVKAKRIDIPLTTIFSTLQAYLGSAYVNDFNKFGRTFQVNIEADAQFRSRPEDIGMIEVRNNQGKMIPLGTLLSVEESFGPQLISRYNLYPTASVTGSAGKGYSSGQALDLMEQIAKTRLPPSMGFEWTGAAYQEKATGNQAVYIFLLAVVFVYLVLCAQYESWSIPFGVILSVPLALLGTVIAVTVRNMDINTYSQIGIVLLVALASKNAILIIEFAKEARESGKGIMEAAVEAATLRFRPILMTSFAFIFGVYPLVVAKGAAAASRQALGTAVFGGMIAATFLTVIFVPTYFVIIQRMSEWMGRGKKKPDIRMETPPESAEKEPG